MTDYLDHSAPLPYCAGCGHPHVLKALDQALAQVGLPAHRYALVTDIGCVGLADAYFPTLHTVHALHGRAAAVAAGIQLGTRTTDDVPLKPVVLVGDGGSTIGLLHLVHAAQLDIDVTVIVHNNLIYGMTGGQHSGFTPEGLKTTTTPTGSPLPPLDLGQVLAGAGCSFFGRCRAPGDRLVSTLVEAIRHPGFACVEALELCPTFAARIGGVTGKSLNALVEEGHLVMGIQRRGRRPVAVAETLDRDPLRGGLVPNPAWARLARPARLVVAGRAGERAQSAAKLVASAACAAGLHATVRTDNPVTQGKGFSVAEVTISPERINYTGLVDPDLVVVCAPEGLAELTRRGTLRGASGTPRRIVVDASIELPTEIEAGRLDLRKRYGPKAAALGALAAEISALDWWSPEAWSAAIDRLPAPVAEDTRKIFAKAGVTANV